MYRVITAMLIYEAIVSRFAFKLDASQIIFFIGSKSPREDLCIHSYC